MASKTTGARPPLCSAVGTSLIPRLHDQANIKQLEHTSTTVLSAADLVVMVILTTYSDHGNVIVSARSVHLVVNGNASSSGTLIGQTQQQAEDCQTLSHGVLWRRFDIDIPGSAKQHEAFDALAEDDKIADEETRPLVVGRTCTSSTQSHHQHYHHRHHRRRRRRRRSTHLCQVEKCRLRMREDVFPSVVESGRCVGARTCMFGLYECVPRRHMVRLLRRLSDDEALDCLPPPAVVGHHSDDDEDVWIAFDFHVTVACECSRRRDSGVYSD